MQRSDERKNIAVFRDAIFQSELAVYMLKVASDGSMVFIDANDTVAAIANRPLCEIRGKKPVECLPPMIGECLQANSQACIDSHRSVTYERSLSLPSGNIAFRTQLIPALGDGGKISHIVGLTRDITHEKDVAEDAQRKTLFLDRLGVAQPNVIYMFNIQTMEVRHIGGTNSKGWQQLRRATESLDVGVYAEFVHPDDREGAFAHVAELTALQDDEVITSEYRFLNDAGEYVPYATREVVFARTHDGQVEWVIGVSVDVSDRNKAQQEIRDLSKRMLTLQLEERRRIAQELHDSTGQHLTTIGLALERALTFAPSASEGQALVATIEDAKLALAAVQREIRVLSYLLHPPEINSKGLCKAISDFAIGFGKRAGFSVDLEIDEGANAASDDISLNLFRVCQEALTNVYRHADATSVGIALEIEANHLTLRVADDGRGFNADSADLVPGIGLVSMRERLAKLGGALTISSETQGTTIVASIPTGNLDSVI